MGRIERMISAMAFIRNIVSRNEPGSCDGEQGLQLTTETAERPCSDHADPANPGDEEEHLSLRVGMASKRGPRQKNDDFCAISWKSDFFALSDGIGGAPYGDVMSRVACNAAVEAYDETGDLEEAFARANAEASKVSSYLGEQSGATLLLARLRGLYLELASVGDSMAYRLRDGRLEAAMPPGRVSDESNALSKAVGYGPTTPDGASMEVRPGDRLVLCSDGIWEYVEESELVRMLGNGDNAPLIADGICRRAADVGNDNSTCICIIVERTDGKDAQPPKVVIPFATADTPTIAMD